MDQEPKIENLPSEKLIRLLDYIKSLNDPNFTNLDASGLDEADADFFAKFESGTLSKREYDLRMSSIPADNSAASKAKSWLFGHLGNKVMTSGLMERWTALDKAVKNQENALDAELKRLEALEQLRDEISEMKKIELGKKERGEEYNPHFEEFNPNDLEFDDLEIYQKFKDKSLDRESLNNYNAKLPVMKLDEVMRNSRHNFYGLLVNLLSKEENLKWWNPEMYNYQQKVHKQEQEEKERAASASEKE